MAMLIYTSGTTGLPKPAVVSLSKCIVGGNHVLKWMGVRQSDILYTCMPLYHSSASILGFCTILEARATLAIGRRFSTKTFWLEVRASNATVIQYVGETCRYLLAADPQRNPETGEDIDKVNSVRIAFGNGLRPDVWNKFKSRFAIDTIAEFYSMTEGSSAMWNYSRNDFSHGAIGHGGALAKLLAGRRSYIVEMDWETEKPRRDPKTGFCKALPLGAQGEMIWRLDPGDISRNYQGYFNNAQATDSKVIRNVFQDGDAFFRSGDVTSKDKEGRIFFHDRLGDTFRWKSENVSTTEVSEVLGQHPAVQEANVYGVEVPHHDGRAGCAALVLAEQPSDRLLTELAAHVKQLPKFAVPIFLRVMKNMDLARTGTNKQQKHVLRAQGVEPEKMMEDEVFWLRDGVYVRFKKGNWEELRGGKVKL